jgi:hypothetical protein
MKPAEREEYEKYEAGKIEATINEAETMDFSGMPPAQSK